jgi:general secretion pathway protein A
MYYDFFGFREPPFSIAPDPRYLYLSDRHKEALAHLMYGVQGQGGFIVITGEVGTGKTTVSRCFVENVPAHVDIALVLNPRLSAEELLSAICDELEIPHPPRSSIKELVSLINDNLLEAHAAGRHKVLMIDEAQNLSADVLEQLRLLTNLETTEKKLLQIVLLGQPELQEMLALPQLRQLNQRVTARYHLEGLGQREIDAYLRYRLGVAGLRGEIFSEGAIKALYRHSQGIPRLINLISDRALLGAYAQGEHYITAGHIRTAAAEVNGPAAGKNGSSPGTPMRIAMVTGSAILAVILTVQWVGGGAFGEQDESAVAVVGDPNFVGNVERVDDGKKAAAEQEESTTSTDSDGDVAQFSFDRRQTSLARAFEALFDIWGKEYDASQSPIACDFAQSQGLRCLETRMSRQGLIFLNRPAILHLRDNGGQTGFVVLKSLAGQNARVATAAGNETVSFDSIEPYWHGQFTVLWALPRYETDPGARDTQSVTDKQVWLSARMMEIASQQATDRTEENRVVRMNAREQVRWYQSKNGLTVDGIAGAMTIIQMNNDLNLPVPRLDRPGGEG